METGLTNNLLMLLMMIHSLAGYQDLSGSFTTGDGSQCTWFNIRSNLTATTLVTACMCTDPHGRSQTYGCEYTAELHSCEAFVANSEEIINGLVKKLSGMRHSCEAKVLAVPQCKGLVLMREHEQEAAHPCIPPKPKNEL